MLEPDAPLRRAQLRIAWTSVPLVTSFLVYAWLSTQVEALRAELPFTEDPFDAVVSFAVIGIAVVGGTTIFRVLVHARRPYDPVIGRRVAIGAVLSTAMAVVAFASDALGVMLVGVDLGAPGMPVMLWLLAAGGLGSVVAIVVAWRDRAALLVPPVSDEPEPDLLDDLGSFVAAIGAVRLASYLAAWVERSPLSPRRHRLLVGVVAGVVAGFGAIAWHAFREGPWVSEAVALFFGALMAAGVCGAYLLGLGPLRLLRSPRAADPG